MYPIAMDPFKRYHFPPVEAALEEPNGLLAVGGDLSPGRLLAAYRRGIFPWFGEGDPIMWWSPDPRMVLFPEELHVPKSLRRRMRRGGFEVTFDRAFREVIRACGETARAHEEGTWITPEMEEAYITLHEQGHAHSAETWMDGRLVGGLYGVQIGRMYYGESMFYRQPEASKLAFVALVERLRQEGVGLIDCQQNTAHLARFGAREIPRREFIGLVERLTG